MFIAATNETPSTEGRLPSMPDLTTVTSYGRTGASARVRVFEWVDWLGLTPRCQETYLDSRDNSVSTLIRRPMQALAAEKRLRALARSVSADSLVLSRQASPFSTGALESKLLRSAGRGVYDFDDALFNEGGDRIQPFPKHRIWNRAVEAADMVIAGNDYLAERAAKFNSRIIVVPSCVNTGEYKEKDHFAIADSPRAVWIGSPSTEAYLSQIAPALLQIHRSRGLRLTLISAGLADLGPLGPMIDRVDWDPHNFAAVLANADIGIMPLTDNEWTRGKCAYKLLQYGAAGLPMIGSPVGVNRRVLEQADGIAAETHDDWVGALEQMIDEPNERRSTRGTQGRMTVERHYSFEAWSADWLEAVGLAPSG